MREENKFEPAQDQSSSPQPPRKRVRSSQQKRRQQSATQYIVIMFATVFVLLLFTLLMERRENQDQIDDLQQTSVSATQRLNEILEQNEYYKARVERYEQNINELETDKNTLSGYVTNLEYSLDKAQKSLAAMDWFWQIDEAYAKGKYSLCRSLIRELDEAQLTGYLPAKSVTDNGRYSPADRLEEIRSIVF